MTEHDFRTFMELQKLKYRRTFAYKYELDSDNYTWRPFWLLQMDADKFTWSFSALKEYINCPKQYQELKVLKRYEKAQSEQMLYGTAVHKALEDYTRDGVELAKNYLRFKTTVDAFLEIPGTKHAEYEMALTRDKKPCAFDSEDRWVRGIADLVIIDGKTAYVIDWKTGSAKYPDSKQLKLMAIMIFAHFPEVNDVRAGLMFIMHDVFITEEYNRSQIDKLWSNFTPALERLKLSYQTGEWKENPTALCGWCPVETCKFHKER